MVFPFFILRDWSDIKSCSPEEMCDFAKVRDVFKATCPTGNERCSLWLNAIDRELEELKRMTIKKHPDEFMDELKKLVKAEEKEKKEEGAQLSSSTVPVVTPTAEPIENNKPASQNMEPKVGANQAPSTPIATATEANHGTAEEEKNAQVPAIMEDQPAVQASAEPVQQADVAISASAAENQVAELPSESNEQPPAESPAPAENQAAHPSAEPAAQEAAPEGNKVAQPEQQAPTNALSPEENAQAPPQPEQQPVVDATAPVGEKQSAVPSAQLENQTQVGTPGPNPVEENPVIQAAPPSEQQALAEAPAPVEENQAAQPSAAPQNVPAAKAPAPTEENQTAQPSAEPQKMPTAQAPAAEEKSAEELSVHEFRVKIQGDNFTVEPINPQLSTENAA